MRRSACFGICNAAQDCTGRRGRRPLQTNQKVAVIARFFGSKTPPYSTNAKRSVGANSVRPESFTVTQDCTGEQCSPLQECGFPCGVVPGAQTSPSHPSVTFGDTAYAAGPLCRCATSPHTVWSHPSRGAILYGHRVYFGPGGVKPSGGGKALRKMQHSCIF